MILPKIVKSYNENNHIIKLAYNEFIFQSYDTIIFYICEDGLYFVRDISAYTKTTSKYMYQALFDIKSNYYLSDIANHKIDSILNSNDRRKQIFDSFMLTDNYLWESMSNFEVVKDV